MPICMKNRITNKNEDNKVISAETLIKVPKWLTECFELKKIYCPDLFNGFTRKNG